MPNENPLAGSQRAGEHPRLDWHLENWARYMRDGGMRGLDCQTDPMWSSNPDFDGKVAREDQRIAIAVDALISDLTPVEQAAVHHMHLSAVYGIYREPLQYVYERARLQVSEGLRKRAIW